MVLFPSDSFLPPWTPQVFATLAKKETSDSNQTVPVYLIICSYLDISSKFRCSSFLPYHSLVYFLHIPGSYEFAKFACMCRFKHNYLSSMCRDTGDPYDDLKPNNFLLISTPLEITPSPSLSSGLKGVPDAQLNSSLVIYSSLSVSNAQTTRTYHSVSALCRCCACSAAEALLESMEDTSRDARSSELDTIKMACALLDMQ